MIGRALTRAKRLRIFEMWALTDLTIAQISGRFGVGRNTTRAAIREILGCAPGEKLNRTTQYPSTREGRVAGTAAPFCRWRNR